MRITIPQLATYIVRDGARLLRMEGPDRIYRVPAGAGGHFDVRVTPEQYAQVWSHIERMPAR